MIQKIAFVLVMSINRWPITRPPRAEAFSRPSAIPVTTQRCVCNITRPRCSRKCGEQPLCISCLKHWPSSLIDPYRLRVSNPVKSRSCRHSGRTDDTCYERCRRSQFCRGQRRVLCPSQDWLLTSLHLSYCRRVRLTHTLTSCYHLAILSFKLSTVSSRAFPVAATKIWNALPDNVV